MYEDCSSLSDSHFSCLFGVAAAPAAAGVGLSPHTIFSWAQQLLSWTAFMLFIWPFFSIYILRVWLIVSIKEITKAASECLAVSKQHSAVTGDHCVIWRKSFNLLELLTPHLSYTMQCLGVTVWPEGSYLIFWSHWLLICRVTWWFPGWQSGLAKITLGHLCAQASVPSAMFASGKGRRRGIFLEAFYHVHILFIKIKVLKSKST